MTGERPYAMVTITDVYGEVRQISGTLASMSIRLEGMERRVTEIEACVDVLDRRRYALSASALSAAVAAGGAVLTAVLG
ncbi:hypothetical protein HNR23_003772 [Nocardiopsis mwathae]|uniref:Uncharacterized protein n=1 Tax=Nocardiopsis mwathae TaxID=1472723 RepID=A0A7W9YK79_9ACTN|nr:hypothetical protein [Nocardiopsis mwathae]MBB6173712.1 hypothetical protein [Nocardiopsis mwathae]